MTVLISRKVDRDSRLDSDGYIGVFGSYEDSPIDRNTVVYNTMDWQSKLHKNTKVDRNSRVINKFILKVVKKGQWYIYRTVLYYIYR